MSGPNDASHNSALDLKIVHSKEAPGILVVSESLDLVDINAKASSILQYWNQAESEGFASQMLPSPIRSFCRALLSSLPFEPNLIDRHPVHTTEIINAPHQQIFIHGLWVPDMYGGREGRLLLIVVPMMHQKTLTHCKSIDRIMLTPREKHVAQHLADGLTNKEIANKLDLSEYTVKDHVKRLMRKTQTTTRTAVVSKLIALHKVTLISKSRADQDTDDTPLKHTA